MQFDGNEPRPDPISPTDLSAATPLPSSTHNPPLSPDSLRRSNERYRRLLDHSLEGVVFINERDIMEYANMQFARMLGFDSPTELIDRPVLDLVFPEDMSEAAEIRKQREQGLTNQYERRLRRKDGSTCWVLVTVSVDIDVSTGQYCGTYAFINDLTDRKQSEESLAKAYETEKSRAEREAILNEIGNGIRRSVEPEALEMIALEGLGKALGLDYAYLADIDVAADAFLIRREWRAPDCSSLLGLYRLSAFGVDIDVIFRDGHPCVVNDTRPDSQTRLSDANASANAQYNVSSLINVPFFDSKGQVVGALCVAMTSGPREWKVSEVSLLETVASQLRSAVDAVRTQRRERNIADQLQQALIPDLPARVPGLKVGGCYHAALDEAGVGGDFGDVFQIDDMRSAIVVADLSGKGLAAASQVATVRNMLRYSLYDLYRDRRQRLCDAVRRTNAVLATNDLLLGFATLFAGIWDAAQGTLTYVNAGQEPGLVWRSGSGTIECLSPTGPVFGTMADSRYDEYTLSLAPGDILAVFTDGFTEVGPSRRELFGIDGIMGAFQRTCERLGASAETVTPDDVLGSLLAEVRAFAGSRGLKDDLCAIVLTRAASELSVTAYSPKLDTTLDEPTPPTVSDYISLVENAPDIIARYGSDLRLQYVNVAVEGMLGIPRAELIGRKVSDLAGASNDNVWAWNSTFEHVLKTGKPSRMVFETPVPTGNPVRTAHFEVILTPELDEHGKAHSIISITRDITARVELERSLRDSEARNAAVVNSALDCIITIDVNERVIEWNPAAVETFGYSREDALGRALSDLIIPERFRGAHTAGIQKFLQTGEGPALNKRIELSAIRANGEEFPVELTAFPILSGDTYIFTAYLRDLSEREQIATQRRTLMRDMLLSVTDGKFHLCHTNEELPPPLAIVAPAVTLQPTSGIATLRSVTRNAADGIGFSTERTADLVTGVSEAAMNAVIHGGGGVGTVHADASLGRIQVIIVDHGAGISMEELPHAALSRGYSTKATLGHGLKMIIEFVDRIYLLTGQSGTTVVLEKERIQPMPAWLDKHL